MALDSLFKLDPTSPTSNSNYAGANIAENCAPSGINNALRALGSFIAQQLCYQSAALSASVSTNIATTSTGLLIPIVGANAINSFGVVPGEQPSAAVIRFLQYSSSASLSHGGSIRLQGGVSRKTQPGDFQGVVHVGSGDTWHEFLWSPADGGVLGQSISVSLINSTAMNTTSMSTSVMKVAGQQEFPRYCFMAVDTGSNLSITNAATQLIFASETFDIGGFYASNAWTPAAGKYRIHVNVGFDCIAASEKVSIALLQDGVSIATSHLTSGVTFMACAPSIDLLVDANGSNAYTVQAWKAAAGVASVIGGSTPRRTWFCGERI